MDNSETSSGVLSLLMWGYGLVSQIMTLVFFIQYCKVDDSIFEIVCVDSILSEIKGLLWIFFIW